MVMWAIFLFFLLPLSIKAHCTGSYHPIYGLCLHFYSKVKTLGEAKEFCESRNSQLPVVFTPRVNDFLQGFFMGQRFL